MKRSRIPQLTIKQQGYLAATAQMIFQGKPRGMLTVTAREKAEVFQVKIAWEKLLGYAGSMVV